MYLYVLIYKDNFQFAAEYITLRNAIALLQKRKAYIFRIKSDDHILYLNHPLSNSRYSSTKINIIDEVKEDVEDNIDTLEYIEIRLTPNHPSVRVGVNMDKYMF